MFRQLFRLGTRRWIRYSVLTASTISAGITFPLVFNDEIKNLSKLSIKYPDGVPFKDIDNVPLSLNFKDNDYTLLGAGTREVSFLKFRVYALGLYIENKGINNGIKFDEILNLNYKYVARVCAIRNTDLSHLRDGFVRTIKNNELFKELSSNNDEIDEKLSQAIDKLRLSFNSVHCKAPRNSRIYVEIDNKGLKFSIEVVNKDGKTFKPLMKIGDIEEPLMAKILLHAYTDINKPLIKDVQTSVYDSINTDSIN